MIHVRLHISLLCENNVARVTPLVARWFWVCPKNNTPQGELSATGVFLWSANEAHAVNVTMEEYFLEVGAGNGVTKQLWPVPYRFRASI